MCNTQRRKYPGQSTILKLLLQLEEGHFSTKAPPALDRLSKEIAWECYNQRSD